MGVIKKHYEDVRLSEEQKAEIKFALKERFPQYARTGSEMEVKIMENERIIDTGARVKSHSKLKAGIAATAAAALLLTAGVAAVYRMDTGISPGSAQMGMDDVQTGYIDDESSPYFANARTIFSDLAKRSAEFELQGIRYAEDCAVINRDTVLSAREQNITCEPQEGEFVSALELAAKMDEQLKEERDIDLGELDFEFWIDTNKMTPQYVFIYPDESRSSWYSFPRYEEKQSGCIEDEESEYFVQAAEIYDTFFKALAEAELKSGDIQEIDKFGEIFEQKLREIYGDEFENINYEIRFGNGELVLDLLRDDLTPENVHVYVYIDEGYTQFFCYPDFDVVTVPDVTGMSIEQAEGVLNEMGLNVVLRSGYDDIFPEDTLTAIEPPVGQRVAKGSSVTLYISKGSIDTAHEAEKTKEEVRNQEAQAEHAKQMEKEADVTSVTVEIYPGYTDPNIKVNKNEP